MDEIKENKKHCRKTMLLTALCWLTYVCSYIGKLGYTANIVQVESFYKISHANAGIVSTFFFFAYGAGQIINGLFCRKYNIKYVVFGALIISSIANFTVGITSNFEIIKYLWLINGMALSVLWPLLVRYLSENLSAKDIPGAVIVMGTTVATGTFLVYGLSAIFAVFNSFKTIFFIASVLLPIISLIWFFSYNHFKNGEIAETTENSGKIVEKKGTFSGILLWSIMIMGFFAIITNLVKDGLTTWVPTILKEYYNMPDSLSILLTLILPVFAIFGTAVAVALNKKITDYIILCAVLYLATGILISIVMSLISTLAAVTIVCFAIISCFMSSVNNILTSMVPLYMKDKLNSGMLAGIMNGLCYVGSTLSSYGLGLLADNCGWSSVFKLLFICCIVCVVLGVAYFIANNIIKSKNRGKRNVF